MAPNLNSRQWIKSLSVAIHASIALLILLIAFLGSLMNCSVPSYDLLDFVEDRRPVFEDGERYILFCAIRYEIW